MAMAPGTRIAALDVFTLTDSGQGVFSSDALAAIDAILERADELNIVAVNLSLGGGFLRHSLRCPRSSYANAFEALRDANIIPVVAAGNGPYSAGLFFNGVEDPACAPGSLVVGALYDADYGSLSWPQASLIFPRSACEDPVTGPEEVTCFSQTASYLGVLAPGSEITAGGIAMSGTSQATPHVSGAIAVIAAAAPGSTHEQREAAIVNSGIEIFDPRNNTTKRRLELCGALSAVGAACGGEAGVSFSRQAVPGEQWRYYLVDVEPGTRLLSVSISGSGDADLYTRQGSKPDQANNLCEQEGTTSNESCVHTNPASGRWWIGVFGFEDAEFTVTTAASDVILTKRAALPMLAGGGAR
jgi:subtilisin family serine protease